jgi:hypothetical protein
MVAWFFYCRKPRDQITDLGKAIRLVFIDAVAKLEAKGWTEAEITIALVDFVEEHGSDITGLHMFPTR